jgi:hypothetical protein
MDHREIVLKEERGEILIGIEPALARRFFIEPDHESISQQIGEPIYIERFTVRVVWLLQFVLLLGNLIASVFAIGWFAIITIPLTVVLFGFLQGRASTGKQSATGALIAVAVFTVAAFVFTVPGSSTFYWVISLPLPYLFTRLTYKFATALLRMLCIRNEKVFNLLNGQAIFIKEV